MYTCRTLQAVAQSELQGGISAQSPENRGISQGPVGAFRALIVVLAFLFVTPRDLFEKGGRPRPKESPVARSLYTLR